MRSPAAPFVALLAVLATAGAAAAHPDVVVTDATHRVPAGGEVTFPIDLHYHRLVGEVRAPAGGAVTVAVQSDGAPATVVAGPGERLLVNELIRCCKGAGWTHYEIVLANEGPAAANVAARLVVLHDGIAVLADDAETGAAVSMILMLGVPAAVFAGRLRDGPAAGDGRRYALAAGGVFLGLWSLAGAFAAWGILRFGGGPVAASLAATADLPFTGNVIITTHSLVVLLFVVLAVTAAGAWTAAARRAGPHRRAIGALGVAIGAGAVVACALFAAEYDALLVPALVAVAGGALPLVGGLRLLRSGA